MALCGYTHETSPFSCLCGYTHETSPFSEMSLFFRSNCADIFFRKILVPGNDRVFAKNVSQIFRRGQIGPICPEPVARKNLGNKFHFYEPI